MMAVLQDIYPNYSTKLYIVNLPSYLGWFVGFVKGFLCEMVQGAYRMGGVVGTRPPSSGNSDTQSISSDTPKV